jgi:seryl-tRNA synthetase
MLDLLDFQEDKGGDLKKLRESQRRRHAPESVIDDVLALFEDHKKSKLSVKDFSILSYAYLCGAAKYAATQVSTQINATQKEIGAKKKVWDRLL